MDISVKELFAQKKWARGLRALRLGMHKLRFDDVRDLASLRVIADRLNRTSDEANYFQVTSSAKKKILTIKVVRRKDYDSRVTSGLEAERQV